jgi:hypothetical protein
VVQAARPRAVRAPATVAMGCFGLRIWVDIFVNCRINYCEFKKEMGGK